MEPLVCHRGLVAPINRPNIDTDQIIPKQFLKRIERTGFGQFLFYDWRYQEDGTPNPDFVLNRPPYDRASILAAGPNFGCGSSREHAPWALADFGFRVIIAPSFADIFYQNCFKNGLLPLVLPQGAVDEILDRAKAVGPNGYYLTVDVEHLRILDDDRSFDLAFALDPYLQETLLYGLDDISRTLRYEDRILAYERAHGK
ncbi:MAG: 3-isopropylmalate dehydratase small subunit [Firmicutes bacterium]|nr:3-isopropylmalate dehydratase small subunit [Alicyclobacillaceae bacterium]MCL6498282.1 3-isopropylmalate dehydratase small subunit [Bacillota bacterium]